MPIYHFNIADHVDDPDETGTELPDDEVARIEAVTFVGAYLRDNPRLVWDGERFCVVVTDEQDRRLFTVSVEAKLD